MESARSILSSLGITLSEKIGRGTYGSVFKAVDSEGKAIALKQLAYNQQKNGVPHNVIREIKYLKNLRHPNIATINDVIFHPSLQALNVNLCITFDYFEHDLAGLLMRRKTVVKKAEAIEIMRSTFSGLSFLHTRCSIIHRDIKPSNILLNKRGEVKIADFGLARQSHQSVASYTGNVVTVWYRAPELLRGSRGYDYKIDVWSLGCIFAEILLGRPLFAADTELQVMKKIENLFEDRNFEAVFRGFEGAEMEFLKGLLQINPRERLSADQALRHPFLKEKGKCIPEDMLESHEMQVREEMKAEGQCGRAS